MNEKDKLKRLKVEKGYKTINWTHIISIVLICIVLTAGISIWIINNVAVSLSNAASDVGQSVVTAFEKNPELMFAFNNDLPQEALYFAILKYMSAEASVDFYGYFTTKTIRSLEKVNLSCMDKYQYRTSLQPDFYTKNTENYIRQIKWFEQLKDIGCSQYHIVGNLTYFKCPLRNCEHKEVTRIINDEFIPQRIGVKKVSIEGK